MKWRDIGWRPIKEIVFSQREEFSKNLQARFEKHGTSQRL